ncbi:sulfatase family protein [Draconibacterium sediminis]|uniref:Sulfatase n=1 Tax=Draconibacterium sediminis TaxID=1544798 RepID=A0A0D8JF66_9BACT|nr:sulfatase [Draconibacterium sediminis]KJF45354.1 sulfatase [Draconibacterium sediminis]
MSKIYQLYIFIFFAILPFAYGGKIYGSSKEKPNIIWIFSDDHSYQTIGAYGGRFAYLNPTPNIDRLAHEGMRFDRCYVENSICAPSRATLLTGKFSHVHGKYLNQSSIKFDHNQQQFQKLLQQHGYQTAMIGKIHLDGKMQGFDYWDVLPGQGKYYDPEFINESGKYDTRGYVTDIIVDKALDWIKNKRDKSKPFMLMIHQKAPHRTWIPAKRHMSKYADVVLPESDNLFDDYASRTTAAYEQKMSIDKDMTLERDLKLEEGNGVPDGMYDNRQEWFENNKPEGEELVRWKYQSYMKDFLRCVWGVDENVGRVLDFLEESGLGDNTVVFYSSDQGFYNGEHGWFDKRFMYEESFRTPLLARWPDHIKPGSVNMDLVQNIDFAETFLDLAGVDIPGDMQGCSLVPLLQGETPEDWRESLYYHYYEYPGAHSVRKHEGVSGKRFKLIRFYGNDTPDDEEWELYDLKKDSAEMNNLYDNPEYTQTVQHMKEELNRLKEKYKVKE